MGQSWSSMRKQLEQENICEALKGRIQYFVTRYRQSHDEEGRVAIRLDGREVFQTSYFDWHKTRSQVIADSSELKETCESLREYWNKVQLETKNRGSFDQYAFYSAFHYYQNHSIEDCLASEIAIVRLFAVLDRRTGKRRLEKLLPTLPEQPDWLKFFYCLRMEAEGIHL